MRTRPRCTKREEDRAYSLFGIFDVNLPLIYGEGRKAFLRLQEAILQNSTDLSLLAWDSADDDTQAFRGLLAQSPDDFADGSCLVLIQDAAIQQTEIRITNKGIHFKPDVMLSPGNISNASPLTTTHPQSQVTQTQQWAAAHPACPPPSSRKPSSPKTAAPSS